MIYSKDVIEDLLKCSMCKEKFQDGVKLLTCGNSICLACSKKILDLSRKNAGHFQCTLCNAQHSLPANVDDLIDNLNLVKLLDIGKQNVYKSETMRDLKKSLSSLAKRLDELRKTDRGEKCIKSHFDHLRFELQESRENAMDHLNSIYSGLLADIDEHEKRQLTVAEQQRRSETSPLNRVIGEADAHVKRWETSISEKRIRDEAELSEQIDCTEHLLAKIAFIEANYEKMMGDSTTTLKYKPNKLFLNQTTCLGSLDLVSNPATFDDIDSIDFKSIVISLFFFNQF